jgi:anti-sigma factor RsiW
MERVVTCNETLRVQAYFDGEVDGPSALAIERHLEGCAECQAWLEDLERGRAQVRRDVGDEIAPAALHTRVTHALDAADRGAQSGLRPAPVWRLRAFWMGAVSGVGTLAATAVLAFLLLSPLLSEPLLDNLVSQHVGSLLPGHLISVASSDHHTVKPWFAGHADVSPIVEDFSAQGFRLLGGRSDYIAKQRAAVVVYQHGLHVINVFSWRDDSYRALRDSSRDGYHLLFWRVRDLRYCAVSDAGWSELEELQRLMLGVGARDRPGA